MLTHDEIMALKLFKLPTGDIANINPDTGEVTIVFDINTIPLKFHELILASGIMYQALTFQKDMLNELLEMSRLIKGSNLTTDLEQMLGTIEMVQQIASSGIDSYLAETRQ